ncbi:MAG TPA: ABC transporter permease, partial [Thermoanaerobaculia bacterium]|nr:ABC transporter permease [Thermoanaerobaculia bacterium]
YLALLASSVFALLRNKMRSVLTILGITIGIAAVICVVAIGKAGQARVEQQLNNLGDNFVWIEAGGRAVNGVRTGPRGTKTLTLGDAIAIKNQIPLIKAVSPNVDSSTQIVYGNQNWFTSFRGVSPEYFDIKRWAIDQGAPFTQDDVDHAAAVCVIGRTVRDQLFGVEDPIGKVIRVKTLPMKVVATMKPKGLSMSGQDQDDTIIIPYTTAQKKLMGITWLDDILCSAVSQDVVKLAGQQARALLRDRHHLRPEQDDDFNIRNPEDIIQAQLEASRTLTLLLIAIASISLIVGGIGIMNVMLVSVTERTREIGVRVSVGATEEAIQLQFLAESVMLSLVGGAAGVIFGVVGSVFVGRALDWPMELSMKAIVLAAFFSIAVGVFFGYYPARKASLMDPIEALRYE